MFNIAIAVFLFKRTSGLASIFSQISKVQPERIYLIGDGPRNDNEKEACEKCRVYAESLIDWKCDIRTNYAKENRGVYQNIGQGAKWVFGFEDKAIFLEDDNYPEDTFFQYCKEMLDFYEKEEQVFWICGTNYINSMELSSSYVFTQHLLPCGWASWADKFDKYYDGELKGLSDECKLTNFKNSYTNKALYRQQLRSIKRTRYLLETNKQLSSWDFQMLFSIRANGLFGIAPCNNQIRNIGADDFSIHGGSSMKNKMTSRFCFVNTVPLLFPLISPPEVEVNKYFERKIGKIILYPISLRIKIFIGRIIKYMIGMNKYESLSANLRNGKKIRGRHK